MKAALNWAFTSSSVVKIPQELIWAGSNEIMKLIISRDLGL
jgi:hypothetical protein